MEEQQSVRQRGGTMRLGAWPCVLDARTAWPARPTASTRSRSGTGIATSSTTPIASAFEENGFVATGMSPDGTIVEIIELPDHPWFLAVQFHPEFKSKPTKAHPLFRDFIAAALARARRRAVPSWNCASRALTAIATWRSIVAAALPRPARWVELDDRRTDDRRDPAGRRARRRVRPDDDWVAPAFWDIQTNGRWGHLVLRART